MLLFRSLLFYPLFFGSTVVLSLLLVLLGWALPYPQRCRIAIAWGRFNLWALRVVCGLHYRVSGLEQLPATNAVLLVKHQSAWETFALWAILGRPLTWVLKRELMWVPIFGWALAIMQPVAIDRKAGKRALREVVEQGRQRLQQGRWVVIFPEGTRTAPGERRKYGAGGALLAERSGFPVVPIAHNAGMFWRRRGIGKYPGVVEVKIGPLIETQGLSAGEINQRAEAWIEAEALAMLQTAPDGQGKARGEPRG
jgi:1-acyl-sn-glycerol-3-phosphate acyltransferase